MYCTRYIGVFNDNELTWKEHIRNVYNYTPTVILNKDKHILAPNSLYVLHCALLLHRVTYCGDKQDNEY